MLIKSNPATAQLHDDWRKRIKAEFSEVNFSNSTDYLCIINYLDNSPQRFYSKEAFNKYLLFLEETKLNDPILLGDILKESESLLSVSNKILSEINIEAIHDIFLPEENNELIDFIDKKIHYNLLKLYETPFYQLSLIIAKYLRLKANKGIDGLDLYNTVNDLKKTDFSFVEPFYLHDARNGIAHGKIIFSDLDITYVDKKGKKVTISKRNIIEAFDKTLDIANGFCLAFKLFCLTNPIFLEKYNIPIPQSILLEELQAKANGPAWKITNCLESVAMHDKKQLMIYVKNDNWDYNKVNWYAFVTALWAEALTKSYDRIFFSIRSSHSQSHTGWAAYDASKFKKLRELEETNYEAFKGVLEGDLIFFIPKIKFPSIVYKIGTFRSIIKMTSPLAWRNYIDTYFPSFFYARETKIHSNSGYVVINGPSVVIKPNFNGDIEELIRKNRKKIVKLAIKYSRKQVSLFSLERYLPVKYIRLSIYNTDMRVRNLRGSGLIPELVATIEVNSTKRIKTIDIIGGTPEQIGKYRIVWNKRWKDKYLQNLSKQNDSEEA